MDKYYTPDISEFHVGFEYEVFQKGTLSDPNIMYFMPHNEKDQYFKFKFPDPFYGFHLDKLFNKQEIRIKYLDKEDIESLGFTKRLKNQWVGWKDYIKEISNHNYEYFMRFTLHTPTMGSQYKIYVHRHLHSEQDDIEGQLNYGESELVYKGLIKNKSELLKLLKQLGIDG